MTRGRKKDLTIPPTRALVQQRDYRARKAHYVTELEERCRKAEEENAQLRKDLDLARASLSVPYLFNPLATELSAELQHNIALVSSSLAKFQDFANQHPLPAGPSRGVHLPPIQDCLRSPSSSSSTLSPPALQSPQQPLMVPQYVPQRGHKRLCRADSPSSSQSGSTPSLYGPRRSSSPEGSECCGGYFDCTEICEREHEHDSGTLPAQSRYRHSDERLPPRHSNSSSRHDGEYDDLHSR